MLWLDLVVSGNPAAGGILLFWNLELEEGLGEAGGVLIVFIEKRTCFSDVEKSAVSNVLSVISMLREVSISPSSVFLSLSRSFWLLKLNGGQ